VVQAGAPPGTGRGVVIMVHGRGAGPANILDLVPRLERPDITYLAPTAAGRTWYPHSFMAEKAANEPWLSSALRAVARVVDGVVAQGVATERVVLLGFSQGACLTCEFAAAHAARYGGVVAFSGGLIGPPGTAWAYPGSFGGTPVFLGSSDPDAHVPRARVEESAAVFTRMGAAIDLRIYPGMGHTVCDDEITAARALLDAVGR
jgi:phospholipase/carboxylesterase